MLRLLKFVDKNHLRYPRLIQHLQAYNFSSSVNRRLHNSSTEEISIPPELSKFRKSEIVHGFIVDEIATINELYITVVELTHMTTGSKYLHVARDDNNNVFSIGFRTTPMDSTGLPHILEHTTLCGSRNYPCRDPFFKMLRRSLATYMNAMTGPDYTIYPFSTQNIQDYRNLQSVYLDSVFYPNLKEWDFRQEGWRLEHQDPNDKSTPIMFKGVVFNEMKGVFNSSQALFCERVMNYLLPSHTYAVVSGGDPLHIPTLKYTDLLDFHDKYYHPTNARFYSYGNFPLEDHLKFIDEKYLCHHRKRGISSKVPRENQWTECRRRHITCAVEPMTWDPVVSGTIGFAYRCSDIISYQKCFALSILARLFLRVPQSEFYKSLIETRVATKFAPSSGYDAHCRDTMFILSLQGVEPEKFELVERIYNETLDKVIENGFDKDHIEADLHGIELSSKHQGSNFGLNLLHTITPLWNHDGNVIDSLRINKSMEIFRNTMKTEPYYLQQLAERYLRSNTHKLILTMVPDAEYEKNVQKQETELLEKKLQNLSEHEIEKIYTDGLALQEEQQKEEDVNTLPTLKITDIKEDVDRYHVTDTKYSNVPLQIAVAPTNGVTYYRGIINTRDLPTDLKTLLPLFTTVITKMGTRKQHYRNFDQQIQAKTGGLHLRVHVMGHKDNILQHEEGILIQSYCLDRNVPDMFDLWTELFNYPQLDLGVFTTVLKSTATDMVNRIPQLGHFYAISSAASYISATNKLKDNFHGLRNIRRLVDMGHHKKLKPVLCQMHDISQHTLNKKHLRSAVNLNNASKDMVLENIDKFYQSLGDTPDETFLITTNEEIPTSNNSIHHVVPFTVNAVAKAILTVPFSHEDYAPLQILSTLLTSLYLHPEIREKGGAYGGGAKLGEGAFIFYSYRDPNSIRTLDIFENSYEFLQTHNISESDIFEAKLGTFQHIDAPTSAAQRGVIRFMSDTSDDEIQRYRERLKAVTKEQLMHVAEKYLKPGQKNLKIGRALIGPSNPDLLARDSENWSISDDEMRLDAIAAM